VKIVLHDRARLIRELIVAEVLALPGRGPLALGVRARMPPPAAGSSHVVPRAESSLAPARPEALAGSDRER
jgi:hypothetical protein